MPGRNGQLGSINALNSSDIIILDYSVCHLFSLPRRLTVTEVVSEIR